MSDNKNQDTKPTDGPPPIPPRTKIELVTMSNVQPDQTKWLWKNRIALGKLNLLQGDGENAKSLTTLDIAARGSVGAPMPGCTEKQEPFSTIIIASEDAASDTIRPRLETAGADCTRIHLLASVEELDGTKRPFNLVHDIELLRETIDRLSTRATRKLLIGRRSRLQV